MRRGWHWWTCPHCNGEGWNDVVTGCYMGVDAKGVVSSGSTSHRQRCECCDGCGRVKVPDGYHLKAAVTGITITAASTNPIAGCVAVSFDPDDYPFR